MLKSIGYNVTDLKNIILTLKVLKLPTNASPATVFLKLFLLSDCVFFQVFYLFSGKSRANEEIFTILQELKFIFLPKVDHFEKQCTKWMVLVVTPITIINKENINFHAIKNCLYITQVAPISGYLIRKFRKSVPFNRYRY